MKYFRNYKYYTCRALDKLGLIGLFSFDFTHRIGAKSFTIPVRGQVGYANLLPPTEGWMSKLIKRLLASRSGAVVDVGMNIGQTIIKIAASSDSVSYLGFEPNPICYSYCKELVEKNGLRSFSIFPVGLSETPDVVALYADKAHASGASTIKDFRADLERYPEIHRVPVMAGDTILEKEVIEGLSFIKLDIEGSELAALRGLKKTLSRTHAAVILEILPVYTLEREFLRQRKARQDELLVFMKDLNYQALLILEDSGQLQAIDDIPVHGDMGRTNYMFLHMDNCHMFDDMLTPST